MSNQYLVAIDETGSFEKSKASKVGGVVFQNSSRDHVRKELELVLADWNKLHGEAPIELGDLHYFDLRGIAYKGKEKSNKLGKEEGKALTNQIVQKINAFAMFAFSSSGFPLFFANEQQAYVDILRTALWGLLTKHLQPAPGDEVKIVIASRSKAEGIMGTCQLSSAYHKLLIEQLASEFAAWATQHEVKLVFNTAKARQNAELIAADFMLGNQKSKDVVAVNYQTVSFQNFSHFLFGSDPAEKIMESYRNGILSETQATLALLDACDQTAPKLQKYLRELLVEIIADESDCNELVSALDANFRTLFATRGENKDNLATARHYCEILLATADKIAKKSDPHYLRLKEVLLRNQINIANHQGETDPRGQGDKDLIDQYHVFFKKNQEKLYATIGERIHHLIETDLHAVQICHFNNYQVAEVESLIQPHYVSYRKLYGELLDQGEKDSLMAKLCGTLGQANAFLYAITGKAEHCNTARAQLAEDIRQLEPHSRDWEKGMHYRIHLELCVHQLDKAVNLIREWADNDKIDENNVLEWGLNHDSAWNLALILKFLGYYHHDMPGFRISVEQIERFLILVKTKLFFAPYPICNALKWATYLAIGVNKPDLARQSLKLVGNLATEGFTLQTIEMPILMLNAYLNNEPAQPMLAKLQNLADTCPGFNECLAAYGWKRKFARETAQDWNVWDIVCLLPYYYA